MKKVLLLLLFPIVFYLQAQDINYARRIVDTLTSPSMSGRGYVNQGDRIAANYIAGQFENIKMKTFDNSYFQEFQIPINTFPDSVEVAIDNQSLIPGEEFVISSSSPSVNGNFNLNWTLSDEGKLKLEKILLNEQGSNDVFITGINYKAFRDIDSLQLNGLVYFMDDKPWWHVSDGNRVKNYFQLRIKKDKVPKGAKNISVYAKNKFHENYPTQNVVGWIEGKEQTDSFFVFCAHYDHLGQMGPDVYFPRGNDNASGTAMILDLARHYSTPENQPDHSMVFMAFSAKEAGLLGSMHYVQNPLFPLENIKFIVNLDMVGSDSEGIKVVNGTVFKNEFELLARINEKHKYLHSVNERDSAANSDHYPFYANGVPSFFIYTLGKECKEYHNIYDTPENVPFTEYGDFFKLLTSFADAP